MAIAFWKADNFLRNSNRSHSNETRAKKQPCAPRFEGGPLGATLIKDGTLGALILPRDRLLAAVRDTKDPQLNILSWSDTVAVMEVVHVWIIAKYGSVACCGTLFDHLAAQLDASRGGLFAKPFGKLTWKEKLIVARRNNFLRLLGLFLGLLFVGLLSLGLLLFLALRGL